VEGAILSDIKKLNTYLKKCAGFVKEEKSD
jgi:hypothetical protein